MAKLILDSLQIRNFRAFSHLKIERLGRVNLITGRNNVGKSCLLEALWLYASDASPLLLRHLLGARNEIHASDEVMSIKYLFHGRRDIREAAEPISIGPIPPGENTLTLAALLRSAGGVENGSLVVPYLAAGRDGRPLYQIDAGDLFNSQSFVVNQHSAILNYYVPPDGLKSGEIERLWDNVALSAREEDVLNGLRLIAPEICRVNLVGEQRAQGRIPMVSLMTSDERLPLKSMGDGVNRMLGLALALVNAKDGLLLLDEVENGIHYSALPDMWDYIFEVAGRLNIQVFATTHDWETVDGFQKAAVRSEEEGVLIRLRSDKGEVQAVSFDESELEIITRGNIEVRW